MGNGTNSSKSSIFIKLGVLAGLIIETLAKIFNESQIDYWIQNKDQLKKKLNEVFSIVDEYFLEREDWQKFYKDHFNWDVDFSQVIIPVKPELGNWRLIFIAKGMTMNFAFEKASKLFSTWRYNDDLDKAIPNNVRNTQNSYAVWVKDGVEPDSEFLGQSTKKADPDMKKGITVLEGIILEMKYFLETGNHLNIKGVTFCSGSRNSDGNVPGVRWSSGRFEVDWYYLDNSYSDCGVRLAVSL